MFWESLVIITVVVLFLVAMAVKALFWLVLIRFLWRKGNKK